ncbi:unnamed protein product [Protopolystoma xenopodis]|uniref:Uncharacterized protein n=1 Tax=Protopolystoma xenopodis TaxID=117903 RepID=A0A3S5CK15_9PLAT|nr:unnamed protein product [Protopolystoma xenopodis]
MDKGDNVQLRQWENFYDFQSPNFVVPINSTIGPALASYNPWDFDVSEFYMSEDVLFQLILKCTDCAKLPPKMVETYEKGMSNYMTKLIVDYLCKSLKLNLSPLRLQEPTVSVSGDEISVGLRLMERDIELFGEKIIPKLPQTYNTNGQFG